MPNLSQQTKSLNSIMELHPNPVKLTTALHVHACSLPPDELLAFASALIAELTALKALAEMNARRAFPFSRD